VCVSTLFDPSSQPTDIAAIITYQLLAICNELTFEGSRDRYSEEREREWWSRRMRGVWSRENHKEKNMKESYVKKLLETSNKIFLIKLWGKFEENSQLPPTSHCLDDINMIQVVHQSSNFSSKFLYIFLDPNKRKNKPHFLPTFFSLHFFFPFNFSFHQIF